MPRPILAEASIHPAVRAKISDYKQALVREVQAVISAHNVVVVGMAMNPFPRKARRLLDAAGVAHQYLEYGSYLSRWRDRSALKFWTGWPTLPMVFVKGQLIGGADDLEALIKSGELQQLLG